jgi:hypothetical protein
MSDLPSGWEQKADQYGRIFYIDHANRKTQWDPPPGYIPPQQQQRQHLISPDPVRRNTIVTVTGNNNNNNNNENRTTENIQINNNTTTSNDPTDRRKSMGSTSQPFVSLQNLTSPQKNLDSFIRANTVNNFGGDVGGINIDRSSIDNIVMERSNSFDSMASFSTVATSQTANNHTKQQNKLIHLQNPEAITAIRGVTSLEKIKATNIYIDSAEIQSIAIDIFPFRMSDKERLTCLKCESKFGVLKKRHHCRSCGDIFCSTCSNYQTVIPLNNSPAEYTSPVRICDFCASHLRSGDQNCLRRYIGILHTPGTEIVEKLQSARALYMSLIYEELKHNVSSISNDLSPAAIVARNSGLLVKEDSNSPNNLYPGLQTLIRQIGIDYLWQTMYILLEQNNPVELKKFACLIISSVIERVSNDNSAFSVCTALEYNGVIKLLNNSLNDPLVSEVASNSLKLALVVIGLTMKTTITKYPNYFSVGNFFLNRIMDLITCSDVNVQLNLLEIVNISIILPYSGSFLQRIIREGFMFSLSALMKQSTNPKLSILVIKLIKYTLQSLELYSETVLMVSDVMKSLISTNIVEDIGCNMIIPNSTEKSSLSSSASNNSLSSTSSRSGPLSSSKEFPLGSEENLDNILDILSLVEKLCNSPHGYEKLCKQLNYKSSKSSSSPAKMDPYLKAIDILELLSIYTADVINSSAKINECIYLILSISQSLATQSKDRVAFVKSCTVIEATIRIACKTTSRPIYDKSIQFLYLFSYLPCFSANLARVNLHGKLCDTLIDSMAISYKEMSKPNNDKDIIDKAAQNSQQYIDLLCLILYQVLVGFQIEHHMDIIDESVTLGNRINLTLAGNFIFENRDKSAWNCSDTFLSVINNKIIWQVIVSNFEGEINLAATCRIIHVLACCKDITFLEVLWQQVTQWGIQQSLIDLGCSSSIESIKEAVLQAIGSLSGSSGNFSWETVILSRRFITDLSEVDAIIFRLAQVRSSLQVGYEYYNGVQSQSDNSGSNSKDMFDARCKTIRGRELNLKDICLSNFSSIITPHIVNIKIYSLTIASLRLLQIIAKDNFFCTELITKPGFSSIVETMNQVDSVSVIFVFDLFKSLSSVCDYNFLSKGIEILSSNFDNPDTYIMQESMHTLAFCSCNELSLTALVSFTLTPLEKSFTILLKMREKQLVHIADKLLTILNNIAFYDELATKQMVNQFGLHIPVLSFLNLDLHSGENTVNRYEFVLYIYEKAILFLLLLAGCDGCHSGLFASNICDTIISGISLCKAFNETDGHLEIDNCVICSEPISKQNFVELFHSMYVKRFKEEEDKGLILSVTFNPMTQLLLSIQILYLLSCKATKPVQHKSGFRNCLINHPDAGFVLIKACTNGISSARSILIRCGVPIITPENENEALSALEYNQPVELDCLIHDNESFIASEPWVSMIYFQQLYLLIEIVMDNNKNDLSTTHNSNLKKDMYIDQISMHLAKSIACSCITAILNRTESSIVVDLIRNNGILSTIYQVDIVPYKNLVEIMWASIKLGLIDSVEKLCIHSNNASVLLDQLFHLPVRYDEQGEKLLITNYTSSQFYDNLVMLLDSSENKSKLASISVLASIIHQDISNRAMIKSSLSDSRITIAKNIEGVIIECVANINKSKDIKKEDDQFNNGKNSFQILVDCLVIISTFYEDPNNPLGDLSNLEIQVLSTACIGLLEVLENLTVERSITNDDLKENNFVLKRLNETKEVLILWESLMMLVKINQCAVVLLSKTKLVRLLVICLEICVNTIEKQNTTSTPLLSDSLNDHIYILSSVIFVFEMISRLCEGDLGYQISHCYDDAPKDIMLNLFRLVKILESDITAITDESIFNKVLHLFNNLSCTSHEIASNFDLQSLPDNDAFNKTISTSKNFNTIGRTLFNLDSFMEWLSLAIIDVSKKIISAKILETNEFDNQRLELFIVLMSNLCRINACRGFLFSRHDIILSLIELVLNNDKISIEGLVINKTRQLVNPNIIVSIINLFCAISSVAFSKTSSHYVENNDRIIENILNTSTILAATHNNLVVVEKSLSICITFSSHKIGKGWFNKLDTFETLLASLSRLLPFQLTKTKPIDIPNLAPDYESGNFDVPSPITNVSTSDNGFDAFDNEEECDQTVYQDVFSAFNKPTSLSTKGKHPPPPFPKPQIQEESIKLSTLLKTQVI